MADKTSWNRAWALGLMLTGGTTFLLAQAPAQALSAGEQILLRVRFAQVDSKTEAVLESNLASRGGGDKTPGVRSLRPDLDLVPFLEGLRSAEGGLRILAESNLLTSNAREVSLVAGNSFPVPVHNGNGGITVHFAELGIRLTFQPEITGGGNIRLSVKPEVRTIDTAHGEAMNGFTIPALMTRDGEANIELSEGQSFLIGGLIDDAARETMSRIPILTKNDPILSAIFKNGNWDKRKVVIIVTPELFAPQLAMR